MNKLPTVKLNSWDFLGHLRYSANRFSTGALHSFHVYDFQTFVGGTTIFTKDGICSLWLANEPVVAIYRAHTVKVILNHSTELKKAWFYDFFKNWLGTGLLISDGEKWRQRRKLLTPTFHFDILKDFLPSLNKQSEIFVHILKKEVHKPWINIVPFMTRCSLDIICETTLGINVHSQSANQSKYAQAVLGLAEDVFRRIVSPWFWPDIIFRMSSYGRQYVKNIKTVHKFTKKAIAEKKKEKENQTCDTNVEEDGVYRHRKKRALLDYLIEEHLQNKTFTEENIREEVDTFTFEGHDTTSVGMSWTIYLIGLYPEIQEQLQEELKSIFGEDQERTITVDDLTKMKYLECVIKESLRLYPPVPVFGRDLVEDIEIDGYTIPKGTTCGIITYALHRDPTIFPNPEKFDPERFLPGYCESRDPFSYVPFAAGLRNCIGQRFAMMELKVVLASLFRNFHVQSLDQRDKVHVIFNMTLRSEKPIRVKLTKRVYGLKR